MERRVMAGRGPWPACQWGRVPGLAAGLLLIEWQLVGVVGTPIDQLRTLRQLALAPADPVAPVIAVLAFMAEALVGYLLLVLVLRSLSLLPGSIGRLTGRAVLLVSPSVLRRLLDVLVGGALLAQATLVTTPSISAGRGPHAVRYRTASASPVWSGPIGAAHRGGPFPAEPLAPGLDPPVPTIGPPVAASPVAGDPVAGFPAGEARSVEARPSPRRLAAPLPPWLGGGPSNAAHRYTVKDGDTLWDIAAFHLAPADRLAPTVQRSWQRIYRVNRSIIGGDPDLIHPGARLDVPQLGDDRA